MNVRFTYCGRLWLPLHCVKRRTGPVSSIRLLLTVVWLAFLLRHIPLLWGSFFFSRRLRFLYLLRLATDLYLSVPFDVTSCILFFSLSLFLCEPYLNLKVNRTHCTRPPLTLLLFQYLLTSLRLNTPVNCDTFNFFILICVPVNKSALFFGPFPASFKNSFIFFYLHIEIDYIGIPIQYSVIFHI